MAQVRKVFGIRGEVKVESFARSAEELQAAGTFLLGASDADVVPCTVESVKTRGDGIYLKLAGVDDRTDAELLRGQYLFVEEIRRKQLPDEKFFIDDLVGCSVVNEAGKMYGSVVSVDAYPAQMVYTVKTRRGQVLLPAVREFVMNVDVQNKRIVVRPPEGLFDGEML